MIIKSKQAFLYFIFACAGLIIGIAVICSVLALIAYLGGKITVIMAIIVAATSIVCSVGSIVIAIALAHLLGQFG